MSRAKDYEEKSLTACQVGTLISKYADVGDMLPVMAAALHIWCEDNDEDITAVIGLFTEMVLTANGIEIEEGE